MEGVLLIGLLAIVGGVFFVKKSKKEHKAKLEKAIEQEKIAQKKYDALIEKSAGQLPDKTCPYCSEKVKFTAVKCRHCGEFLPSGRPVVVLPGEVKCKECGTVGLFERWFLENNLAQLIAFVLLLFWILPGLAYIVWAWNKQKCPNCGAVGKTIPATKESKAAFLREAKNR